MRYSSFIGKSLLMLFLISGAALTLHLLTFSTTSTDTDLDHQRRLDEALGEMRDAVAPFDTSRHIFNLQGLRWRILYGRSQRIQNQAVAAGNPEDKECSEQTGRREKKRARLTSRTIRRSKSRVNFRWAG